MDLLKDMDTPFLNPPDWEALQHGETHHRDYTLRYREHPYLEPDPYCGGETGGATLDILYSDGRQLQIDFANIAWTSPEIRVYHRGCPGEFEKWMKTISSYLKID